MKNLKLITILISLFAFVAACSDDDNVKSEFLLSGEYKVVSMESTVAVDMNNDGIKSNDVLKESTMPYVHNFSTPSPGPSCHISSARTSVLYSNETNKGSVLAPFPFQHVISPMEESATLSFYVMQFLGLSFKLNSNNEMEVTEIFTNYQYVDYAKANSVKKLDQDALSLIVSAKIYDFKDNKWVETDVAIKCKKED